VKILSKSGIGNEQISVKKIPRPEACKLTVDVLFMFRMSLIQKNTESCSNKYILRCNMYSHT
jgi:hypothetical protein